MKKTLVAGAMVLGLAFGVQVANADTYTVQAGDTVSAIAYQHGTTVAAIANLNSLDNPNLIYVGDKLEIGGSVNQSAPVKAPQVTQVQQPTTQVTQPAKPQVPQQQAPKQVPQQQAPQQTAPKQQAPKVTQKPSVQPQQSSQGLMSKTSGQLSQAEINQVAAEMASRTGESSATWSMIINRESRGNVNISNSQGSGATGLFQLMRNGQGTVGQQINEAAKLYGNQGIQAWSQTAY